MSAPTPLALQDIPIVLRLNSQAFEETPANPDPFFLDFNQLTQVLPGGWSKINQGGPDFAKTFHYPQTGVSWKRISAAYNPSLPVSINITINGVNETGKVFNFEVDIDLDNDGTNDSFISFPQYVTAQTLSPEVVNLPGTLVPGSSTANMSDARIYFKVWRTDTVLENPWGVARVYAGYVRESTITLPWINPAPDGNIALPDNSEVYYTGIPVVFSAYGSIDPSEALKDLVVKWSFDDNTTPRYTGAADNITHVFTTPGCYNITMNITNSLGFSDEILRPICVLYKNIPPSVSAAVIFQGQPVISEFSGFAGVPYNFTAVYDDFDNGKENVTIEWEFDDGSPRTNETNVTHTYASIGTYNVVLVATDGIDYPRSTIVMTISNNRPPTINISDCPTRVNKGTVMTCSMLGTHDPDGFPITSYQWDWGDRFCTQEDPKSACTASTPVASHRYVVPGQYNVTARACDGISCNQTVVRVTVNDQPLAVCPAPVSNETTRTIAVDGSLSRDPDGDALLYRWKFGDGSETQYSPVPTAEHAYIVPKPEGYSATLIVFDGLWTHQCTFTVRIELINEPPLAGIWCAATTLWVGDVMRCSGNQSIDEFELSYCWDFDDTDGVGCVDDFRRDVTHVFQDPGQYTVTLEVTDNKGKTDLTSVNVVVKDNPGYCNQIFDMTPFLAQTERSPADQLEGRFDTDSSPFTSDITAVRRGCWVAYSIDLKAQDQIFIDISIETGDRGLEGEVVDILTFDVANFFSYKDKDQSTLPPNSLDTRCFQVGLRGQLHCELTASRAGTLYFVLDNKDRPVLTASEGPVAYRVQSKLPWEPTSPIDAGLIPLLVAGAVTAVVLVAAVILISRRQEQNY
jgi:PKD repeat protein